MDLETLYIIIDNLPPFLNRQYIKLTSYWCKRGRKSLSSLRSQSLFCESLNR